MHTRISRSERGHCANIHIGGVFASRKGAVVRTVLGSCVAVCLRDPLERVGGMNHFMLPVGGIDEEVSARYGIHAMELLINACMKMGGERHRLEAKVFGGGHVLNIRVSADNVPQRNIRFALDFLETERIPIASCDLGGNAPREIYFHTDSGRVLLRRMSRTDLNGVEMLTRQEEAERAKLQSYVRPGVLDDSNVTLF